MDDYSYGGMKRPGSPSLASESETSAKYAKLSSSDRSVDESSQSEVRYDSVIYTL